MTSSTRISLVLSTSPTNLDGCGGSCITRVFRRRSSVSQWLHWIPQFYAWERSWFYEPIWGKGRKCKLDQWCLKSIMPSYPLSLYLGSDCLTVISFPLVTFWPSSIWGLKHAEYAWDWPYYILAWKSLFKRSSLWFFWSTLVYTVTFRIIIFKTWTVT